MSKSTTATDESISIRVFKSRLTFPITELKSLAECSRRIGLTGLAEDIEKHVGTIEWEINRLSDK